MTKSEAIALCKELSGDGLFAMPRYEPFHNDWEIELHETVYNMDLDRFCRMYDVVFTDFCFRRWEGINKTQDFPVFFRRPVHISINGV